MKVWNITDHPKSKKPARALNMFGSVVLPGQGVEIDDSRKAAALKMADREDVHVGDALPEEYVRLKGAVKAELPRSRKPAHGSDLVPMAAPKAEEASAPAAPSASIPKSEVKPQFGRRPRGK